VYTAQTMGKKTAENKITTPADKTLKTAKLLPQAPKLKQVRRPSVY